MSTKMLFREPGVRGVALWPGDAPQFFFISPTTVST